MKTSDGLCRQCPLRDIGLAHLRDIANGYGGIRVERLSAGQMLATGAVGTTYAFLRSGAMKLEALTEDGSADVIGFVYAGEPIAMSHTEAPVSAIALEDCKVCRLSVPAILGRDDRAAYVLSAFCNAAVEQAIADQQRLGRCRLGDPATRLGHFLNDIAQRTGSGRLDLAMSRSEIAAYLALRPESVSRAMATLQRSGRIAREGVRALRVLRDVVEHRRAS